MDNSNKIVKPITNSTWLQTVTWKHGVGLKQQNTEVIFANGHFDNLCLFSAEKNQNIWKICLVKDETKRTSQHTIKILNPSKKYLNI